METDDLQFHSPSISTNFPSLQISFQSVSIPWDSLSMYFEWKAFWTEETLNECVKAQIEETLVLAMISCSLISNALKFDRQVIFIFRLLVHF